MTTITAVSLSHKLNLLAQTAASFVALSFLTGSLAQAANRLDSVVVHESTGGVDVILESDSPLKFYVSQSKNPASVTIHFDEDLTGSGETIVPVHEQMLSAMRYVYEESRIEKPAERRLKSLVLELDQMCEYQVSQRGWTLSLMLMSGPNADNLPDSSDLSGPGIIEFTDSARTGVPNNPTSEHFVQAGLANHRPLRIAYKEQDQARRKYRETVRAYFPALTGKLTDTNGVTQTNPSDPLSRADFTRREIGVEIGQPLFQSGRILYAERQAKVLLESSRLEVSRIRNDVTFDVLKTLFSYLSAVESYQVAQSLKSRASQILATAQKKKEIGLTSENAYLGALAAAQQADYKAISQEKDREIAKVQLLSALNLEMLPESIDLSLSQVVPAISTVSLNLDRLLSKALTVRPEMAIAYNTVKVRELGRRMARADYLLKVDASAFVGQSGAAFQRESLTMKDSYNVGVKAVLYFSGNSLNSQVAKEKTSPDLGSTSRTETESRTLSVGMLDSLNQRSEYYQSKIEEEKAVEEFRKAKKDVTLEVKESYYNLQKSLVQQIAARSELDYRQKEEVIAETKDKLNQIEPAELLQALSLRAEAESNLKEALESTGTAYYALEKAVGFKLNF